MYFVRCCEIVLNGQHLLDVGLLISYLYNGFSGILLPNAFNPESLLATARVLSSASKPETETK